MDGKFWARLHKHFSEPELVEIGYFVAITMGQQRWLRTLNIEHHQIMAGTDGSMAPGFRTEEELARSKADANYWAKKARRGTRQRSNLPGAGDPSPHVLCHDRGTEQKPGRLP